MDLLEQEAARELTKMGFNSAWGCSGGVFIDSADAFRIIKKLRNGDAEEFISRVVETPITKALPAMIQPVRGVLDEIDSD